MWLPLLALLLGLAIGIYSPLSIPPTLTKYTSIAVLAALDTTIGGARASLEGTFSLTSFLSGFFFNALIAALLVYLGDLLGIDLRMAAIVVFGVRLFNNTATIRRILVGRFWSW